MAIHSLIRQSLPRLPEGHDSGIALFESTMPFQILLDLMAEEVIPVEKETTKRPRVRL